MKLNFLRQSKVFRALTIALAGLLMLWAMAWLVLPMVLKGQLESRLSEQLGRKVHIGLVDIAPWSLELAIDDFSVAYADASKSGAQLSIKRLYIDAEAQSLLRMAPVVDAIRIDSPSVVFHVV